MVEIALTNFSPKFRHFNAPIMEPFSTESKAFLKSRDTMSPGVFDSLAIEIVSSIALIMSLICLP